MKNGYAKFKNLPSLGSREISHYVNLGLESGKDDTAVLHVGVNDLVQKALIKSDRV